MTDSQNQSHPQDTESGETKQVSQDIDAPGWPVGFFDRTYGALADDPIECPPQLPFEVREPLD
jgi:hypothetical protein